MNNITVTVNGKIAVCPDETTVAGIAEKLGLAEKSVVAELNGKILSKAEFKDHILTNGSKLELIRFVGGG